MISVCSPSLYPKLWCYMMSNLIWYIYEMTITHSKTACIIDKYHTTKKTKSCEYQQRYFSFYHFNRLQSSETLHMLLRLAILLGKRDAFVGLKLHWHMQEIFITFFNPTNKHVQHIYSCATNRPILTKKKSSTYTTCVQYGTDIIFYQFLFNS